MPEIKIKIENKIAKPLNNCVICDNSDYTVKFIFDEEWEKEPLRIARFIWNKQYVDVQFTGDTCEVPVVSKTNNLAIGVYAGDLRTTTPAILVCHMSILSEDVIEHSVTPSEYEEIMKLLNAQATDIAALKAVDKRIWTNLDTINKTASAAKVKAEEGVAKADNALANSEANKADIETLYDEKNVITSRLTETENTLNNVKTTAEANKADIETLYDEKNTIASRLTETENTLNNVKTTAETAKTKAEEALARNVFTDEEKAKLAGITNPIIIKGRVDTVEDLPTIAEIGWFYFVGLESASSYQEYCYSETGWEYVGVSQEGVDLSNYYTKAQVDSKNQTLEGKIQGNTTAIESLNKDVGDSVAGIYTEITSVKNKISPLESNVNTLIDEKNIIASRLTTAETNIENLQGDVTTLQNNVNTLYDEKNTMGSRLTEAENTLNSVKTTAETAETKADNVLTQANSNTTDINTLKTDVNALKSVDERIWTNLDTINKTASTAKTKAEEGVAKADNALTATRTNATNITNLQTDVTTLFDEKNTMGSRLTEAENTLKNLQGDVKNHVAISKSTLGYQCKNLLKNNAVTQTVSGVTFTINDDKSITVNGTATAQISFKINGKVGLGIGNYILTGCPSGGSNNTFYLTAYASSAWLSTPDFGSGCRIENKTVTHVVISIASGYTANNLKFYPMLRDANITDNTYEPYKESVDERLIKNKSDIALNKSTLGTQCKNLFDWKNAAYSTSLRLTQTKTESDISVTSTGSWAVTAYKLPILEVGTNYIFSATISNFSAQGGDAYIIISTSTSSSNIVKAAGITSNGTATIKFEATSDTMYVLFFPNYSDTVYTNSFTASDIMLRYADITDDTYEPYKESIDKGLIKNKSDIAVNKSSLGYQRKNLLPYPKSIVKGGITFTCDENGYMTGSNTTSDSRTWTSTNAQYSMYLEAGTYYFSSFAETVCTNNDGRAYILKDTQTQVVGVSTRETHVEKMFTLTESTTIYVVAKVYDGKVAFMIREADITDDSYEPYKPSLFDRCLLKDTAGINLGAVTQSSSITIDNLSSYTALWINVSGAVAGISFMTNLIVPVAYLAKSTSNRVQLAGGIPSSAYTTSEGPLAAKNMSGYITAKVNGNTLDLTISDGTIGSVEVVSLM